jgi:predicted RND superfamily exporter protein
MSLQTLIEPKQEKLDSRRQFLESYTSIVKIYQELVPLDNKLEDHEKRLNEIKAKPKSQITKEETQEVLDIGRQVNRAHELRERLDRIPEEIRKLRGKDTVELSVLDNEINALVEAEKFKAEFNRDRSRLPIEHKVATDALKAIELAESKINELRAEVSGPSGIDAFLTKHIK